MIEPKIIWSGILKPNQLTVSITKDSNRAIDPALEEKLPAVWAEYLSEAAATGAVLYDGTSYRLESLISKDGNVHIEVSPIRFSVRSSLKKMTELESLGEAYYSHGLAIGGLVETSDGKFVFARKSYKSASSIKQDLIGGYLEYIEPLNGEGVFNMNKQELKEEINVSSELIESMLILGFLRNATTDVIIVTTTKLKITAYELSKLFEIREEFELEAIDLVAPEDLDDYLLELGGYKPIMLELLK